MIEVIEGYAFMYTDCCHEVPLILQSFHRTKAGAYRAMRKRLLEDWERGWSAYVQEGRDTYKRQCTWANPLQHCLYRVLPHRIEIHE